MAAAAFSPAALFRRAAGAAGVTFLLSVAIVGVELVSSTGQLTFATRFGSVFVACAAVFLGYVALGYLKAEQPIVPMIGEDNIIWGADYPHPDCLWPESQKVLDKNLAGFKESVRKKITSENVTRLYGLN